VRRPTYLKLILVLLNIFLYLKNNKTKSGWKSNLKKDVYFLSYHSVRIVISCTQKNNFETVPKKTKQQVKIQKVIPIQLRDQLVFVLRKNQTFSILLSVIKCARAVKSKCVGTTLTKPFFKACKSVPTP